MKLDFAPLHKYIGSGLYIAISCKNEVELYTLLHGISYTGSAAAADFPDRIMNAAEQKYFSKGKNTAISVEIGDDGIPVWEGWCYTEYFRDHGYEVVELCELLVDDDQDTPVDASDIEELWGDFL